MHDTPRSPPLSRLRRMAGLLAWVSTAAAGPALAFEQGFSAPDMVVSVPRLPQVTLQPEGTAGAGDARAWQGSDAAGIRVEIAAVKAAAPALTRVCAGAFLRDLVRRPGMPDRDSIYRAPLDASTFLVLYIRDDVPVRRLHGHLLSAVAEAFCVDAHFSRPLREGEDVDGWRTSFEGAAVRSVAR